MRPLLHAAQEAKRYTAKEAIGYAEHLPRAGQATVQRGAVFADAA